MTLHETAKAVYDLSVAGHINGGKRTLRWLENYIQHAFRGSLKLGNKLVMEISLPDGRWMFEIVRFADRADGWGYNIPETRAEEKRILNALLS